MNDQQFRQFLDRFNLSREGYRKVRRGVQKRLRRHMEKLGYQNAEEYLAVLNADPEIRKQCELLLTVSISRFFRDRALWEVLEKSVLPEVAAQGIEPVRIWSAGCASGEEVYSFKIVWCNLQDRLDHMPRLIIVATDMNPDYLRRARVGVYPHSSLREVPDLLRSRYFERKKPKYYAIADFLKQDIMWKVHNLTSSPPGCGFRIILLRNNLLTYYRDNLKVPAFHKIVNSLMPGGYVIVGSHEKVPETTLLSRSGLHPHIYQKREGTHHGTGYPC